MLMHVVRLGVHCTLAFAFVDISSLREPVSLGNDKIGLQHFKINITIEVLKFAYFYGKIYGIPYLYSHHKL